MLKRRKTIGIQNRQDVYKRQILVCTTIIETGVDIPNVNTLIIENADRYGLSQLHQLRGRVGRSSRRAFAYLTFVRGKVLTDVASKRLEAIREFTEFGAGFKIAMRDMEIRGAGNLLGAQQHGHMEAVGYEMYLRLLSEAVGEEKGESAGEREACLLYTSRLGVTPGLTCYWQVTKGEDTSFEEWVELDLKYIRDRSLKTDVKILFWTARVVLLGKGAM